MKRPYAVLIILSLLLFVSSATTPTQGADYTKVGVKTGDWANYSFSLYVASAGTMSGSARVDITQVSGTTVSVTYTVSYGGQSQTHYYSGDISTGSNSICSFVIAAGLNPGDPFYMGSTVVITDAPSIYVAGTHRTVNHFGTSVSNGSVDLYFDKDTGLMLKEVVTIYSPQGSITIEATSTSEFSADPIPLLLIGGVGVGVAAIALVAFVALRARHRREEQETVSAMPEGAATTGVANSAGTPGPAAAAVASLCPNCGAGLVAGASFCASCGASLVKRE
ncbi:MAG: zinc ribbon domain-containing protein [Promethearchaeati archaeon SRVP18_Atabeyarchaeia-1]